MLPWRSAAGWLLVSVWAGQGTAAGGLAPEESSLEVRFHSSARHVPWLADAAGRVEAIFRGAGIRTAWLDCVAESAPNRCTRPPRGNEFIARIEGRSPDGPARCGLSVSLHHVTVYADCVEVVAAELEAPAGLVAAYVLAHEIGHVLLPFGHNSEGIMQPRLDGSSWALAAQGSLAFTADEARLMREALARRLSAAAERLAATDASSR